MAVSGLAKTATWVIRLLQLFFAIILTGIISYMIHQYRRYNWTNDYRVPDELIVSEVASVLALFVTIFSILAVCFLGYLLQIVAAFLDFAILVLYVASAALLRHNYHLRSSRNPLRNSLIWLRSSNGHSPRTQRNNGLVKMLAAGCIIQIFLFLITTILSVVVARRHREAHGHGHGRRSRHAV